MVKVFLFGGIGNQLFQLSKAFEVSSRLNRPLKIVFLNYIYLNSSRRELEIKDIFDNKIFFLEINNPFKLFFLKIWFRFFNVNQIKLFDLSFITDNYENTSRNKIIIHGYFHNQKLNDQFIFSLQSVIKNKINKNSFSENFKRLYNEIIKKKSLSLHMRRGDYLNKKNKNLYEFLDNKYYKSAIENFNSDNFLYVFSDGLTNDDISFISEYNHKIIKNVSDLEEFILMSACANNIMANSTFSYWASIINSNANKIVVAPKNWLIKNKLSHNASKLVSI